MQEITVRGRHSVTGEWFYGYLLAPNVIGFVEVIDDKDGRGANPQIVEFCLVDPESVGQYTGLKDRNGVEIYEGDVIRAKHDDGRYDIGNIVYGSKGAFCLHLPNVGTGIKTPLLNYIHGIMFAEFDFEVIGNIYENPELLK